MLRILAVATLLFAFPLSGFAQVPQLRTQPLAPGIQASPAGINAGAGWRRPGPLPVTPGGPKYPCAGGIGGGFTPTVPCAPTAPGFPFSGVWLGGYGFGGYDPFAFYGPGYGYAPATGFSFQGPVYDPPVEVKPPVGTLAIGDQFPATLVLEFPAPAEVWVDGQKGDGKPTTEWTLTSPRIRTGTEYTFKVKARWTVGGKTYEYDRVVNVASGNRSRALVVAGTEIKE